MKLESVCFFKEMRAELQIPPVFEFSTVWLVNIGNVRLGVNQQNGWCIDVEGKTKMLSKPEDMMPLLPLLEMGREQLYQYLDWIVKTQPGLKEVLRSFPAVLLLKFAFESSVSDYWPIKALEWLDSEVVDNQEICESLQILLNRQWITQQLQQWVKRVMKRSEK